MYKKRKDTCIIVIRLEKKICKFIKSRIVFGVVTSHNMITYYKINE